MDGSVANATAVRIGQQLKNRFGSNVAGTQQNLFEELLKVPVAITVPSTDDSVSTSEVAESPSPDGKATDEKQDASQVESASKEDEEQEPEAEATVDTTLMAATMVAPVTNPTPIDEPVHTDDIALQSTPVETVSGELEDKTLAVEQTTVEIASTLDAVTTESTPALQVQETTASVEPIQAVDTSGDTEASVRDELAPVEVERKASKIEVMPVQSAASEASTVVQVDSSSDSPDNSVADFTEAIPGQDQPAIAQDNVENERDDSRNEREKWYLRDDMQGRSADESSSQPVADPTNADDQVEQAKADLAASNSQNATAPVNVQVDPTQLASSTASAVDPSLLAGLTMAPTAMAVTQSPASGGGSSTNSGTVSTEGATNSLSGGPSSIGSSGTRAPDSGRAERTAAERGEASSTRQLSQQERVRLVQRVARSFSRLGPEGGQVTLKLHPPQLGTLNVTVRIEGQTMSAKLQTETSAARDVLLDNLPVLRERLQEQGLTIERFQVDIANNQSGLTGGEAQNPFPGESNQGSQAARTDIDYRRLARNRERLDSVDRLAVNQRPRPVVLPPPTSLTLDIRA